MSTRTQKNSIKKLVSLMGAATASALLSIPALALPNSNSNKSVSHPNLPIASTGNQLLAQGSSGTGNPATGQTGTGGTGTGNPATGQTGTGGTGTGGATTGQTGTGGTGTGNPATGQTGTGGTGTGNPATGQTGTGGTGTGNPATGQTGTGGTGTGGTGTGETVTFEQLMRAGYVATQQRDYQTALTYFQRAEQMRPGNPYATRAIRNVRSYIQRGPTNAPTNQSGNTTTPTNQRNR